LLYARGDIVGSIEANRRADQLGDPDGAYNLRVLLQQSSDLRGAEGAFKRADQRGHGGEASAFGRILEKRGDATGAEAAYRRAEERGDASGSYGLGTILCARGDRGGAIAAFRQAAEQGHTGAPQLFDLLEKEISSESHDSKAVTDDDLASARQAYAAAAASEALRDLKRICESTRSRWSDTARNDWDRNYFEPVMADAGRIVDSLGEAERQIASCLEGSGKELRKLSERRGKWDCFQRKLCRVHFAVTNSEKKEYRLCTS
jgi:tetratricopeptide (TPR) repeat protein